MLKRRQLRVSGQHDGAFDQAEGPGGIHFASVSLA